MRRLLLFLVGTAACSASAFAASPLANTPSAFLRSHADSPVQWLAWGEAAFERARQEQRPLFVAVGLFTNELSRAMARQTFANAETAAFLNENFVCVLVDAREHPDVVALYQAYLQTKQLSGLPMNLWLTPELKPFEGANYLPPTEEWGKEGFLTVARRAASGWAADPTAQRAKAAEAVEAVIAQTAALPVASADSSETTIAAVLGTARDAWRARFDSAHGGFGEPPKYAEPELLRFLLASPDTRELALTTLRAAMNGALRDPLDGGFYRYVIDPAWRQPYFQKTLADQTRIALALLDAAEISGEPAFAHAARGALFFVVDRLGTRGGDFVAALDATPETVLAAQLWTVHEIGQLAGETTSEVARLLGVLPEGNLPGDPFPGVQTAGRNVLYRAVADPKTEQALRPVFAKMLAHRDQKSPALGEDVGTSGEHGMLLAALAQAGARLTDDRFTAAAQAEFAFIREKLISADGTLRRFAGRELAASAWDYAMLATGLRDYGRATDDKQALALASTLAKTVVNRFFDAKAGRFLAASSDERSGIWAPAFAPARSAGSPPSAEALMLPLLSIDSPTVKALASALMEEAAQSGEPASGDVLLALSALVTP